MDSHGIHLNGQLLYWLVTGSVSILFFVLWFWIRRWIENQDTKWEAYLEERAREKTELMKAGGFVTRDLYYKWCEEQRDKCPTLMECRRLVEWRNGMMDKGGGMTRLEHTAICKEITKELGNHFTERVETMFENHREWVAQELKMINQATELLTKLIEKQIKIEAGRWDGHDEQTRKNK